VVADLKKNYQVLAPTTLELDLVRGAAPLDLLVREGSVDTIIHLASPRIYTSNESMGTTLVMLKNVLDVCGGNGLSLTFVSGWQIYTGYRARELRADESLAPCPGDTYGYSKLLCETLIERYSERHGIPCLILRSSAVYGRGSDRPKFMWNFLQKALRNAEIITHRYANGHPCLDLLHIDDLRRAITAAIDQRIKGVINLGTGTGTSTADIAMRIVSLMGSRSQIRHAEVDGYASNIVMDSGRAAKVLDWRPEITVDQGLEDLVNFVRSSKSYVRKGTG